MTSYAQKLAVFCEKNKIKYSSPKELEDLNRCTYAEHLSSDFAIFPSNRKDIQLIITKVRELKTTNPELSIYTISRGRNWGYGSATPTSSNTVLLCLTEFENKISWIGNQFDKPGQPYGKKLGLVKVTASVTQQQLYEFLQREGGEFWMDATGAPTDSSIVGNYLERGFGHTKMGDHFRYVMGMEVILPDGTFIKTGHAGCKNAANIGIHKHGIGPVLEGLFSQSNLGIVTALYLELMPAKKCINKFFIQLNNNDSFYEAIEKLQPLKMKETLSSQMHCGNAHKGIQAVMRYPFKETNGKTPLPGAMAQQLCRELQISPWTISGAVYGDSWVEVWFKTFRLIKALKGVNCKKIILPEWFAGFAYQLFDAGLFRKLLPKFQKRLFPQLTLLKELIKLKKGVPTNYFIDSIYWRKRHFDTSGNELNPDKDKVGMIWIAPIAPMTKENVRELVEISTSISEEYQFEPAISITLLNDKAADCILSIIFDREVAQEEQKALQCYDKLMEAFNEIGFTSYRASSRAMIKGQLNYSEELIQLHKKLKKGLDESNLFSPGHYL
jgi:4-cresol dehydrogenase (hydroxylating)